MWAMTASYVCLSRNGVAVTVETRLKVARDQSVNKRRRTIATVHAIKETEGSDEIQLVWEWLIVTPYVVWNERAEGLALQGERRRCELSTT